MKAWGNGPTTWASAKPRNATMNTRRPAAIAAAATRPGNGPPPAKMPSAGTLTGYGSGNAAPNAEDAVKQWLSTVKCAGSRPFFIALCAPSLTY
jgi:hypothetical protein